MGAYEGRRAAAFRDARKAIDLLEALRLQVDPPAFELGLTVAADPSGALASELQALVRQRGAMTDDLLDLLAIKHLAGGRQGRAFDLFGRDLYEKIAGFRTEIAEANETHGALACALTSVDAELGVDPDEAALRVQAGRLSRELGTAGVANALFMRRLELARTEVDSLLRQMDASRAEVMRDALTGLANRKALEEAMARALASGAVASLAMVDVDHFKAFNDRWGHPTGDEVLQFVASALGDAAREPRRAFRFGGEEFAVLYPGEDAHAAAAATQEALRTIAAQRLHRRSTGDDMGFVTVSAGVAQRLDGEDAASWLGRADAALYDAKRAGRNRVEEASTRREAA